MKKYIIAIIGSGSTYTPELIEGLIARKSSLPLAELRLMDTDITKNAVVGGLCKRMLAAAEIDCPVLLTDDLDKSLVSADFVITQIRVGKLPARILDETIPLKYDLIGQETTGMGGFFKALRTVPIILDIAHRMETLCPQAFLVNFANPAGIVTQALLGHSNIKSIGLCNVPINMISDLKEKLHATTLEVDYLGLNHLTWITKAVADDQDQTAQMLSGQMTTSTMKNIQASGFSPQCIDAVGGIPSSYLEYFYNQDSKLKEMKAAKKSRGEVCQEIESKLLDTYQDVSLHSKPKELEERGGAKYSLAAISLIDAIANDKQEPHVVNTANRGALQFMDHNDVIEITAIIGKDGAKPVPIPDFSNTHIITMMRTLKEYEHRTVSAALTGSTTEAMRAMLIHPLMGDSRTAWSCFSELLAAHKIHLPNFFQNKIEGDQHV